MTAQEIATALNGKRSGAGWICHCPAHDDKKASLSITEKEDNILFYCHAGCSQQAVMEALKVKGLWKSTGGQSNIVETYDYEDSTGQLVYQNVRLLNKDFFTRRPDGNGGWINSLKGIPRVLYHLTEVEKAVKNSETIYIVEGEKDADNLRKYSLCATTNIGGCNSWRIEYTKFLEGGNIVVIPDNDEPGKNHAQEIVSTLYGNVSSVRLLELPGLSDKEDVSDWLKNGGTIEKLRELVQDAEEWEPAVKKDYISRLVLGEAQNTDLTNSEELVKTFGDEIRYCYEMKSWLYWDGMRWSIDQALHIDFLAQRTVRNMYKRASDILDLKKRQAFVNWVLSSEGRQKQKNMIEGAKSLVPVLMKELDTHIHLLNVKNGTIDLQKGILLKHDKANLITKLAPVTYDISAECPTFMSCLETAMDNRFSLIKYLQVSAGYTISGYANEKAFFVLNGPNDSGKTTYLERIKSLLGEYAISMTPGALLQRWKEDGGDHPSPDIARMKGKRFAIVSEPNKRGFINEELIKILCGGDTVTGRMLHQNPDEFRQKCKVFLMCNQLPKIRSLTGDVWERIRRIPFDVTIPLKDRDRTIGQRIDETELSGILNWAIEGFLYWQENGLHEPQEVIDATADYKKQMDSIQEFIEEKCTVKPGVSVQSSQIYSWYKSWMEDERSGEDRVPQKEFSPIIEAKGFIKEPRKGGKFFIGIKYGKDDGDG